MVKTIGNPLTWGARKIADAGHDAGTVAQRVVGEHLAPPEVRSIGMADLREALRLGLADFAAMRTDVIMIVLLYPIIGGCLIWASLNNEVLPLVFPLISGFALLGPVAAVGLYEMSRRRELGLPVSWLDGFKVLQSASFVAVLVLGLALLGIFFVWMITAYGIFMVTLGPEVPASIGSFLSQIFTTSGGWQMIILGFAVGFVFAAVVLAISVVSFPLLLDRHVGVAVAMVTSVKVAQRNPVPVAAWGLIVSVLLVAGSIPLLLGLIVVMPVLGHATWHLYRRAVVPPVEQG